ncbi:MAG: dihydroorotate dehydrogenase [Nitrospinota bacterium]|nr:dihydroorotate dehydrogenase [Nitrospinota bacterium]
MLSKPDISVKLGGLLLNNPVIAASGTFGYGLEFTPFLDLNRLGGFCTKGLSLQPRTGNPVPRVFETASGMLNAIGLENVGFERFRDEKLPLLQNYRTCLIANFFGETIAEYTEMAAKLSQQDRLDALEMNISCPNVEEGGLAFSSSPQIVEQVVKAVRPATQKFLIVKLSPNVTDIRKIAQAAEEAGADAVSLVNTCVGMALDIETRKPFLANGSGGLSGPAIKPIALNMVYQVARTVSIPVIGIGGIRTAEDALEFLMAGASAVQVGTANFFDPTVTIKIIEGIERWCAARGVSRLSEISPGK